MTTKDQGPPRPKDGVLDIAAYVGGKSKAAGFENPIKLSSNENILGSSPKAMEAYEAVAPRLNLYPDSHAGALREALAETYGLEPERLVFGCGSNEIFMLLAQAYLEPGDNIVQAEYGFLTYRIAARACQAEVKFAAQPNWTVDVDALLAQVDARTKLVFIANPDNPTGAWLSGEEVRRLHQGLPSNVILVLDSAYIEFATDPTVENPLDLARSADNVVVTRTFSKVHGLAALRLGWAYASAAIVDALQRVQLPFATTVAAQEAAIASLRDRDFFDRSVALVDTWRPWLAQQLGGLGFETLPSQANFLAVRFPPTLGLKAADAEAFLARRGIIVRGLSSYRMPEFIRITIGLEEHNRAVVDALAEFVGQDR